MNWVLDADIQSFFDTIDHGWMMRFLEHRIADRRMLRLIRKWLNAGVIEAGIRTATKVGTRAEARRARTGRGGSLDKSLAELALRRDTAQLADGRRLDAARREMHAGHGRPPRKSSG